MIQWLEERSPWRVAIALVLTAALLHLPEGSANATSSSLRIVAYS